MNAKEIWKDVEGYEGLYQVSDQGRLKALAKKVNTWNGGRQIPEKIIKPIVQHSGYAHVGLWRKQECKQARLHRLVASAFCPNPEPSTHTQVNHINENKLDNRACNLEWCTPKHNTNHGTAIARRIYGRERAVCGTSANGKKYYFKSQADANSFCGVSRNDSRIARCCNLKQKTAYGFVWNYTDSNKRDRVNNGQLD